MKKMRKATWIGIIVALVAALVLAACGGGGGSTGPNPEHGKQLYNSKTLGSASAAGCVTCHNYDATKGDDSKAPFTQGTATRAATRVPGLTAEQYIRESIMTPDAYVVEKYKAGDMYQNWAKELSKQEIDDLIAYLLTEK
jgi:mono/diheme cytochrome c family protein